MGAAPPHKLLTLLKLLVMYTNNSHEDSTTPTGAWPSTSLTEVLPSRMLTGARLSTTKLTNPLSSRTMMGMSGSGHCQRAFFWKVR